MNTASILENYLLFIVLPLWIAVGAADWLCHRAAHIATTSGPKESAIHLLMLGEAGVPVLMGLFLEINGLIIAVMVAALILHEFTAYWDVTFAADHRTVTPLEQRIHDYLGAVPFMATSGVIILHWPQALSLVGLGSEDLDLTMAWKQDPLSTGYIAAILGAIAVFILVPYAEELLRGIRARRAAQGSHTKCGAPGRHAA